MANTTNEVRIGNIFIAEAKKNLADESLPRILKCLSKLDEDEIWFRPNAETVSVGNLVLHLCGNVRQWIVSGLGGAKDVRVRDDEFSETGPIPTPELETRISQTVQEACKVLDEFDTNRLADTFHIQGYEETAVSVILHIVEHFSYHTGQITFAVKSRKAIDMGYYADVDLDVTG